MIRVPRGTLRKEKDSLSLLFTFTSCLFTFAFSSCYILNPSQCFLVFNLKAARINLYPAALKSVSAMNRMELKNLESNRPPAGSEQPVREFFDHQAASFDARAGLPDSCCRLIARAVLEFAGLGADDLVLELGAGTGQIGQWFSEGARYVGLDLSAGMLREFRERERVGATARLLVRADANAGWPIADRAARAVFGSRTIHLLNHEHVAREVFRVAAPSGAMLITGRVRREPESIRARMARRMNELLLTEGFEGRGGEKQNRKLFEAMTALGGAESLEPVEVTRWTVSASPRRSLRSWQSLVSLGGVAVPPTARDRVLTELESWAQDEFGHLDREFKAEESYVLYPISIRKG